MREPGRCWTPRFRCPGDSLRTRFRLPGIGHILMLHAQRHSAQHSLRQLILPAGRTSLTSTVASVTPRPNLTRRVTCSHGLPATAGLADADHEFLEGLRDHLAILRTVPVKDQGEQIPPPDQNGVRADLVGAGRGAER